MRCRRQCIRNCGPRCASDWTTPPTSPQPTCARTCSISVARTAPGGRPNGTSVTTATGGRAHRCPAPTGSPRASAEVAAVEAAWQGDWEHAVDKARAALDALTGGPEIRRYQALWYYLTASWAILAVRQHPIRRQAWLEAAARHFADARAAATGTRWLAELSTDAEQLLAAGPAAQPGAATVNDQLDELAITQIAASPLRQNTRQFTTLTRTIQAGLGQHEATPYEQALNELWRLAGASGALPRSGAPAEPDGVWMFGDLMWLGWEAKTETEDPDKPIPAGDVREANSHLTYAERQTGQPVPEASVTLYVTDQQHIHHAAPKVCPGGPVPGHPGAGEPGGRAAPHRLADHPHPDTRPRRRAGS